MKNDFNYQELKDCTKPMKVIQFDTPKLITKKSVCTSACTPLVLASSHIGSLPGIYLVHIAEAHGVGTEGSHVTIT